MKHKLILMEVVLLAALALLGGCRGEETPAPAPAPAPPQSAAPVPAKSEVPPPPPEAAPQPAPPKYTYEPSGRRDPFVPLTEVIKSAAKPEAALTPLQKYDLSELRLIGVIVGKGEPTAMVVAPDGKSYILKKGVKVGKNDGVVVAVKKDVVEVEERYYDFSGDVRKGIQEIKLPKREGVE
jgi:type IV pilus assembly protein PilP